MAANSGRGSMTRLSTSSEEKQKNHHAALYVTRPSFSLSCTLSRQTRPSRARGTKDSCSMTSALVSSDRDAVATAVKVSRASRHWRFTRIAGLFKRYDILSRKNDVRFTGRVPERKRLTRVLLLFFFNLKYVRAKPVSGSRYGGALA